MDEYHLIVSCTKESRWKKKRFCVEVDGFSIGDIGSGESLRTFVTPGTHKIAFLSGGKEEKSAALTIQPRQFFTRVQVTPHYESGLPSLSLQSSEFDPDVTNPEIHDRTRQSPHPFNLNVTFNQRQPARKKRNPVRMIILALFIVPLALSLISQLITGQKPDSTNSQAEAETTEHLPEDAEPVSASASNPDVHPEFDTSGYEWLTPELLYEYSPYLEGVRTVTVIQVASHYSSTIQAKSIGREDALTYSVVCDLAGDVEPQSIQDDDYLTIAGTVGKTGTLITSARLQEAVIIGRGEIADDIRNLESAQRQFCERLKREKEQADADAIAAARRDYINSCVFVAYSDVERNPDKYDGTKIKVSGKVTQVIEGWFNGVSLRLTDANGDDWYVSYTHQEGESRILEGDSITAYGECDGVRSVTSIIGVQRNLPAMKMEYYSR